MSGEEKSSNNEELQMAYQQVCSTHNAIADFRAKLLSLLPLASGTGVYILLNNSIGGNGVPKQSIGAVGVLGFFVTLGLFFYELRGIQQCNRLIEVGKSIEECLNIRGQFLHSIDPPRYIISHTFAARVIYPAVLAAWAFLTAFFFTGLNSKNGIAWWQWCFLIVVPLVVILVFFVGSFKVDLEGHLQGVKLFEQLVQLE